MSDLHIMGGTTGFTAVTNVHMNQGNRDRIGGGAHHVENAPFQDGALFFFRGRSVTGQMPPR